MAEETNAQEPRDGLATRSIHAGETRDPQGAIHTPLYSHSTFAFDSTADLLDVVECRRDGNLYTRHGLNPTIRSVERPAAEGPARAAPRRRPR